MRAAVDGIDRVRKRIDRFGVRICVLDGGFHADVLDLFFHVHNGVQVLAVAVEVAHERGDAAFEVEGHLAVVAFVHESDGYAARHERHFAEALYERVETVIDILGKDLFIEFIGLLGAAFFLGHFADLLDGALRHAALVLLLPKFPVALDLGGHPL